MDDEALPAARLADAIRRLFRQGIRLNQEAWHFITSSFCRPSVAELGEILADEDRPEQETILELIFFPDIDQQATLEEMIHKGGFTDGHKNEIVRLLFETPPEARLILPGEEGGSLLFPVPEWAADAFVSRLRIGKRIDPRLIAAVLRFVPEGLRATVRVGLRNARFPQTERHVRFLCNFFRETDAVIKAEAAHANLALMPGRG